MVGSASPGAGYVLWGGGASRSAIVEMVLAEAGAPFELRAIDIGRGESRSPAFLQVNGYGWVPALTTPEGETIAETPAINLWLCERHGLDLVPPPHDPERGAFLGAFCNVTGEIEPTMKRIFYPRRYVPSPAPSPQEVARTRGLAWAMLADRLEPIERRLLAAGPFFLSQRFSLADLTLAYWLVYAERQGMLAGFPALSALLAAARARPALAPVLEQHTDRVRAWPGPLG